MGTTKEKAQQNKATASKKSGASLNHTEIAILLNAIFLDKNGNNKNNNVFDSKWLDVIMDDMRKKQPGVQKKISLLRKNNRIVGMRIQIGDDRYNITQNKVELRRPKNMKYLDVDPVQAFAVAAFSHATQIQKKVKLKASSKYNGLMASFFTEQNPNYKNSIMDNLRNVATHAISNLKDIVRLKGRKDINLYQKASSAFNSFACIFNSNAANNETHKQEQRMARIQTQAAILARNGIHEATDSELAAMFTKKATPPALPPIPTVPSFTPTVICAPPLTNDNRRVAEAFTTRQYVVS